MQFLLTCLFILFFEGHFTGCERKTEGEKKKRKKKGTSQVVVGGDGGLVVVLQHKTNDILFSRWVSLACSATVLLLLLPYLISYLVPFAYLPCQLSPPGCW